jgi:Zn-dependent protease
MVRYPPPEYGPPRISGRRRGGILGGILTVLATLAAWGKYALLLVGKVGALKTLLTLAISFGAYAIFFGPSFAAGLVVMILVHEMGHVVEIRRQGMRASAPLFIPFFGAAIFQRQHPQDALRQAQIGIAGPIAGTVGATVAFVLYGTTHQPALLLWAYLGFFLNLINLIPLGMLDGGWILAAVSKWFQVVGVALMLVAVLAFGLSPLLLVIGLLSIPAVIERFRNDGLPYYRRVPPGARLAVGVSWLALVGYLGFASLQAGQMLARLTG